MLTAIGGIVGLLTLLIKIWLDYKNERNNPVTPEQDIQQLHNSLAKGDADTVSSLFDELRCPPSKSDKIRYDDPTPT